MIVGVEDISLPGQGRDQESVIPVVEVQGQPLQGPVKDSLIWNAPLQTQWVGLGLNLLSTDDIDFHHLSQIKSKFAALCPKSFVEPVSWSIYEGTWFGQNLPAPYTQSSLERCIEKLVRIKSYLFEKVEPLELLYTNSSFYLSPLGSEMTEPQFLNALAKHSLGGIQVNLSNLVIAKHHSLLDVDAYLSGLDPQCVQSLRVYPLEMIDGFFKESSQSGFSQDLLDITALALQYFGPLPFFVSSVEAPEKMRALLSQAKKTKAYVDMPEQEEGSITISNHYFSSFSQAITQSEVNLVKDLFDNAPEALSQGLSHYHEQRKAVFLSILKPVFPTLFCWKPEEFSQIIYELLKANEFHEFDISLWGESLCEYLQNNESQEMADLAALDFMRWLMKMRLPEPSLEAHVLSELESHLWDRVCFELNQHSDILTVGTDLVKMVRQIERARPLSSFTATERFYLVYKNQFQTHFQLIGRPEHRSYILARRGHSFKNICDEVTKLGIPFDEAVPLVFSFVHRWAGLGLIKGLSLSEGQKLFNEEFLEGLCLPPSPDHL